MIRMAFPFARLGKANSARSFASSGVTLVEWVIAVLILGIISSLAIGQSLAILRRERINSVAVALAGWIEEVRNLSLKEVTGARASGDVGCLIQFQSSFSQGPGGTSIATVNSDCAPVANGLTSRLTQGSGGTTVGEFVIPFNLVGTIAYSYAQTNLTTAPTIAYTPRGTWIPASDASGDLVIKLFLNDGGPMRCLRISETLAFVDIGSLNTNNSNDSCDNASYVRF